MVAVRFLCASMVLLAVAWQGNAICTPPQWEGIIFGKIATTDPRSARVDLFDISMLFSYDQTNQRAYALETLHSTLRHMDDIRLQAYDLYHEGYRYIAYPASQHCEKTPLPTTQNNCVPDSSLLGQYVVAGQPVNVYQVPFPPSNVTGDGEVNISINPNLSVPVSEIVTAVNKGVYTFASYTIANVTAGIHDPSVFILPSYCKTAKHVAVARPAGSTYFR